MTALLTVYTVHSIVRTPSMTEWLHSSRVFDNVADAGRVAKDFVSSVSDDARAIVTITVQQIGTVDGGLPYGLTNTCATFCNEWSREDVCIRCGLVTKDLIREASTLKAHGYQEYAKNAMCAHCMGVRHPAFANRL